MQGREKISDKDLPNLIREGLRHAFMHVESLHSDGVTKIGKNNVSLIDLENRAAGFYSNGELHDLYQHPERDEERGMLILRQIESGKGRATISRRVTTEGLRDTFGVINSELLNFRQQTLVNAAIFEVTTNILGKLMAANPFDPKSNERVEKATRAALKNIDFTKMGMENPGDNKPRDEFIASLNSAPKKRFLQSTSDPLKPKSTGTATTSLRRLSMFGNKTSTVSSPALQPKSESDLLKERIELLSKAMDAILYQPGGANIDDMKIFKDFSKELVEKQKRLEDIEGPQKSPRGPK